MTTTHATNFTNFASSNTTHIASTMLGMVLGLLVIALISLGISSLIGVSFWVVFGVLGVLNTLLIVRNAIFLTKLKTSLDVSIEETAAKAEAFEKQKAEEEVVEAEAEVVIITESSFRDAQAEAAKKD